MHGGELRTDSEQIGDEGFGKFIQSAGTHDVTHDVALGQEDFGMGEYHLSAASSTSVSQPTRMESCSWPMTVRTPRGCS